MMGIATDAMNAAGAINTLPEELPGESPRASRRPARRPASPAAVERVERWINANRAYGLETARRIFGDMDDAQDAVGEATLRALLAADQYDPKQPFARWFAQIVTNVCFEQIRAKKAQKRPQTVCFTSAAQHLAQDAGESGGADWYFDIADHKVDVEKQAIESAMGIADLPDWILTGLMFLPMLHRSLLIDVYVQQIPRAEICLDRGWNEYTLVQQLEVALSRFQWIIRLEGLKPDSPI